jgi:hypothetical protein
VIVIVAVEVASEVGVFWGGAVKAGVAVSKMGRKVGGASGAEAQEDSPKTIREMLAYTNTLAMLVITFALC